MSDRIIYVLCYDDNTEQKAHDEFDIFPWARVYRIPDEIQNHLFEGVMYQTELMKLYDEWKDKKYVGTIAYNMFDKIRLFSLLLKYDEYRNYIISKIETNDTYDFVGFVSVIANNWPYTHIRKIMTDLLINTHIFPKKYGYDIRSRYNILNDTLYYFNYWMTSPHKMVEYLHFFNMKWLPAVETNPLIWSNTMYMGKIPQDKLLKLSYGRCNYYPYHPFVNERLPNFYFKLTGCKCF